MFASIWGSQGFWWTMPSTGFNFVWSYSAVEHQSQKEDVLLFHACPKYCKWNCSTVRLWLCMNLQLNAIECTMILGRPLSCPDLHAGVDVLAFCTPWASHVKSHMPQINVSVQPLQPCHELRGLTWRRRIRNTRLRQVRRFREGNWLHGNESQNQQSIIALHLKKILNSSWLHSYLGRATEGGFWAGKRRWWILLVFDCDFHMIWMVHTSTTAFCLLFIFFQCHVENNYKPIIMAKSKKCP